MLVQPPLIPIDFFAFLTVPILLLQLIYQHYVAEAETDLNPCDDWHVSAEANDKELEFDALSLD